MRKDWGIYVAVALLLLVAPLMARVVVPRPAPVPKGPGVGQFRASWRVLEPITRRNLSIYPVVSNLGVDTSPFLTLDEGLAAGSVRILERGQVEGAIYRQRDTDHWPRQQDAWVSGGGASVNELVLVNDSCLPGKWFRAVSRTALSARTW
jgi:hypothetical protein